MDTLKDTVTVYTGVGNHCLKADRSDVYRFWTAMRHEDPQGGSYIPHKELYRMGSRMGYSRSRVWKIIHKGYGLFWVDRGDGVRYIGASKLLSTLGIDELGSKVEIEAACLYGRLKGFKAALYAANFAKESWKEIQLTGSGMQPGGGKSISRDKLRELTGISRHTQYEYEDLMGIKVEKQFVSAKQSQVEDIPIADRLVSGSGVFLRDVDQDGEKEIVWQTANRYSVTLDYGGTSKVKTYTLQRSHFDGTAAQRKQRMFFEKNPASKRISDDGAYVFSKYIRGDRYYDFVRK